jgi:hypothetical protein
LQKITKKIGWNTFNLFSLAFDERRRPISENLPNLREAFLLPGFSQVNSQWSKVNHHGEFSSGAGTRPAGLRQYLKTDV